LSPNSIGQCEQRNRRIARKDGLSQMHGRDHEVDGLDADKGNDDAA
jgi:hypothetical protein